MEVGRRDGLAGNESNRPKAPAPGSTPTWMYAAYNEGWERGTDERVASKSELLKLFREAIKPNWHVRQMQKRTEGFMRRLAIRQRLRACKNPPESRGGRSNPWKGMRRDLGLT